NAAEITYHNKLLLSSGRLLLLLTTARPTTSALILLEMLTLVQHQMVLLEECLTALAHVRPHRAASVRVTSIMQQQSMLGRKSLATVGAVVGFRFRLLLLLML
uniref:Uncharacterized protein n=1 Tax=Anopheles christyi TaxID=43041 RepID=A0A182KJ11_9DIPT